MAQILLLLNTKLTEDWCTNTSEYYIISEQCFPEHSHSVTGLSHHFHHIISL